MATQVSPGVVINEIDRSDSLTQVALTEGAIAGSFAWGPILDVVTVSSETELAQNFGKPNNDTASTFFTAANFLAYSNTLRVVRAANTSALNATDDGGGLLIKNEDHYNTTIAGTTPGEGVWAAKYAGTLGNSLRVEICASADAFRFNSGAITADFDSNTVTFSANVDSLSVGDTLIVGSQKRRVTAVANATECTINVAFGAAATNGSAFIREWKYAGYFTAAPGTSTYADQRGGANDEVHVVVIDEKAAISGTANTVLERYEGLSKAEDARADNGAVSYYPSVINSKSAWVWFLEHPADGGNWGDSASNTFDSPVAPVVASLSGGVGGETLSDAEQEAAYDLFKDEQVEVSFIMGGEASAQVAAYIINEVVEPRKYAMAFISPTKSAVVDNVGDEVESVIAFRESLPSTSYAVLDSGWKYQYDKYNQVYRYVPLNGDIAGCAARTDQVAESWFSPAGFTRGQLKIGNTVKLAWNPKQADRDSLYLKGVNPVVSFPGEGTVLYGDKTLQAKPSAFDRINVRRLFIVLEKTIDRSAKYQLFEQNDEYTRNTFINLVEPFLRSVKGRRGISDFYVVCDESNNPQDAVDRNEFRADIYVKPIRSVNFIQLNFVAVRSDVAFNEVITNLS
jgi:hypothetical protein